MFRYNPSVILDTPTILGPSSGVTLHGTGTTLEVTLQWNLHPGVTNGASPDGSNVYIEQKTGSTWAPVTGSPFGVNATGANGWMNSSYNFTIPNTGTFRFAVQTVGNGTTTISSPKSSPKWEFSFQNPTP